MNRIVFIIHFKNGRRKQFISSYKDRDAAYNEVYELFPDANYIETF